MAQIRLVLGGDVMTGRTFNDIWSRDPGFDIWGNTRAVTDTADIFSANLETTITRSDVKWPDKRFNYRMLPQFTQKLVDGNLNFVSIANNHILDYRKQGLVDTKRFLGEYEIFNTGAGLNLGQASSAMVLRVAKSGLTLKIGFLCATDHYKAWAAGKINYGVWYIDVENWPDVDSFDVLERVREVRQKCDVLVFSVHFGPNYTGRPTEGMVRFAHDLVKEGVDIVQGHSAHHVLPMECLEREIDYELGIRTGKGLICYSLGDLIDDYAVNKKYRNDLGVLCTVDIDKNLKKKVTVFPTKIERFQVNLLDSHKAEYQLTLDRIQGGVDDSHRLDC